MPSIVKAGWKCTFPSASSLAAYAIGCDAHALLRHIAYNTPLITVSTIAVVHEGGCAMPQHPFRFSVNVYGADSREEWITKAQKHRSARL
jgi:hypothetical protein